MLTTIPNPLLPIRDVLFPVVSPPPFWGHVWDWWLATIPSPLHHIPAVLLMGWLLLHLAKGAWYGR